MCTQYYYASSRAGHLRDHIKSQIYTNGATAPQSQNHNFKASSFWREATPVHNVYFSAQPNKLRPILKFEFWNPSEHVHIHVHCTTYMYICVSLFECAENNFFYTFL